MPDPNRGRSRPRGPGALLVAQTLINILPDEDAECRLLEGFPAGWEVLPKVAKQERLF